MQIIRISIDSLSNALKLLACNEVVHILVFHIYIRINILPLLHTLHILYSLQSKIS